MAPNAKAEEADSANRANHRPVPEHRLARKSGEQVRCHAHPWKDGDIHLGVAEEPEQVLPQQR